MFACRSPLDIHRVLRALTWVVKPDDYSCPSYDLVLRALHWVLSLTT